jgi:hypothetical protein
MGDMGLGIHPPCLELGPVAAVHREDLAIEIQQGGKGFILLGAAFVLMIT